MPTQFWMDSQASLPEGPSNGSGLEFESPHTQLRVGVTVASDHRIEGIPHVFGMIDRYK